MSGLLISTRGFGKIYFGVLICDAVLGLGFAISQTQEHAMSFKKSKGGKREF